MKKIAFGLAMVFVFFQALLTSSLADDFSRWLEREIGNLDPIFIEGLQADFRSNAPAKRVSIHLFTPDSKADEWEYFTTFAFYDKETDIMNLPKCEDKECLTKLSISIPHELWHSLLDNFGQVGVIHHPGFSGPSPEEMASYCQKKTHSPEFAQLHIELGNQQEILNVKRLARTINLHLANLKYLEETVVYIAGFASEGERFRKYLSPQEMSGLEKQMQNLQERVGDLELLSSDYFEWAKNNRPVSEVKQVGATLETYLQKFEKFKNIKKEGSALKTRLRELSFEAQKREWAEKLKSMEELLTMAEDSPDDKLRIELSIQRLREAIKGGEEAQKAINILSLLEEDTGFDEILSNLSFTVSSVYLMKITDDTDEVMARIISSLYLLHFGPPTDLLFPLNAADLEFLQRFKWKGQPMFKKGIEKYRIGLKLYKAGVSEEEIRKRLSQPSYKDGQKTYYWPRTPFQIIGKLPLNLPKE